MASLMFLKRISNSTILFTHCPRTGGTSLTQHLVSFYGGERCLVEGTSAYENFLDLRLKSQDLKPIKFISGHMSYGVHLKLPNKCIYIGLVRHPVERFYSILSSIQSNPDHHLHCHIRDLTANAALDRLISLKEWRHIGMQCEFICGLNDFGLAKRNIDEDYFLVGPTERLTEFSQILANLGIGQNAINERLNISAGPRKRLSEKMKKEFYNITAEDFKLNDYVKNEFGEISKMIL